MPDTRASGDADAEIADLQDRLLQIIIYAERLVSTRNLTCEKLTEMSRLVAILRGLLQELNVCRGRSKTGKTRDMLPVLEVRYQDLEGRIKELRNDLAMDPGSRGRTV